MYVYSLCCSSTFSSEVLLQLQLPTNDRYRLNNSAPSKISQLFRRDITSDGRRDRKRSSASLDFFPTCLGSHRLVQTRTAMDFYLLVVICIKVVILFNGSFSNGFTIKRN